MYIFVEQESVVRAIKSTSHPTETGLSLVSTIQKQPIELNISGRIVDNSNYSATTTRGKIEELQATGSLITYKGRSSIENLQIQSFNAEYDNKTWGGFVFSMTLRQARIGQSSYVKKETTVEQQKVVIKNNPPDLTVGATVIFTGGSVYVSSDAPSPAANRGRSTCKITIISAASWSKHNYHLISEDGGMVYGWVDKNNIEGIPSTCIANNTNSGTQQLI